MVEERKVTERIKKGILLERKIISRIFSLYNYLNRVKSIKERDLAYSQIIKLKEHLKKTSLQIIKILRTEPSINPSLSQNSQSSKTPPFNEFAEPEILVPLQTMPKTQDTNMGSLRDNKIQENILKNKESKKFKPKGLEKITLKRLRKKDKGVVKKKDKKPSGYVKISSRMFHNLSMSMLNNGSFRELKRDIIKSNLDFVPATYISLMFFATIIAGIIGFFATIFFLFFSLIIDPPFIIPYEGVLLERIPQVIWIVLVLPSLTFFFVYFYPSMERKTLESKINRELPFATVHMSSIAGSLVEPSKIFSIIASTGEYPFLEKEFIKLQNEINIYGYDLVTALRNRVFNSPSKKLADLFNGLSTTITSGGNLAVFFEKRAQTLLFEYRLDMEKQAKAAETFMDIYISLVVAAPMILMLLLMMMGISGLGISLSPLMISVIMILSISAINIIFIGFLHLKGGD